MSIADIQSGSEGSSTTLEYQVDPTWPQELPARWVLGQIGSVCTDADDNVVILNRRNITEEEQETSENAPPVIVFDKFGKIITTWGDPDLVPMRLHGSFVDEDHNVWLTGMSDGIIQKYNWDGELLLQIGERGVFDTSDGTIEGAALNAGKTQFFNPAAVAVDPENGDIYVADGYGNRRIAVFDRSGAFLRQWGRQGTRAEAEAGKPGAFIKVVHGVAISNAGLVYVCDRQGDRIQVFEKDGNFVRNIWIRTGTDRLPDARGTAWWLDFSPDPQQQYLYVMNGRNEQVHVLIHETGDIMTSFGRPGRQLGAFTHGHTLAVDSAGSVYVAETDVGRRVQKFKIRTG